MKKITSTEFVQSMINNSDLSINDWSKALNVSRQSIYNWMSNVTIKIRKIHVNKIATISGKNIVWVNDQLQIVDKIIDNKITVRTESNDQSTQSLNDYNLAEINDNLERQIQLLIIKYEHAFHTASDPMAVVVNENFTSMNLAMEKLLAVKKRRNLFGANIYDILSRSFRKNKEEKESRNNSIGKFEFKTTIRDINGKENNGILNETRFWIPTNKFEKVLCSIMTFYPSHK